jgi:protocatechuate 3,4-dioxygenase beta subunit
MGFIFAEKEGMAVGWTPWSLVSDTNNAKIVLNSPAVLSGIVVDANNKPVPSADVRLFQSAMKKEYDYVGNFLGAKPFNLFATTTDESGKFIFSNLPQGMMCRVFA